MAADDSSELFVLLGCRRQSCLNHFFPRQKLLLWLGSHGVPHGADPCSWRSQLSVGKAALALDLGDGKVGGSRLDHSIGPFEMGPFTEHCQSDILSS